jgi:hypothetical protein
MPPAWSLTALYETFLVSPRHGRGACATCFNLTDGYDQCFACSQHEPILSAVLPISYSVAHEPLHAALAGYKRLDLPMARVLGIELSAVLWRFLEKHEPCLAGAAGTECFEIVTTVPSGDVGRDERHPLRWLVAQVIALTRDRHERLLHRSTVEVEPRVFSPAKYEPTRSLRGEAVLLIDDTWTTGASAQSAAAALLTAGARAVAALVIGRHINREWGDNDVRLRALPRFSWQECAECATRPRPAGFAAEATAP